MKVNGVVVNVNVQVALKIQLNVGSLTQTVEIVEGASLINESAEVVTLVDRQLVGNIPLNGRTLQSLITLTPGTVLTRATGIEQGQFSINGQRADANYFTVNGVSANIAVTAGTTLGQGGGGTSPGLSAFGGTNNLVSADALQEFKIQTSTYAPEFGRMPGGRVSIVTRSGSKDFHGTLFEYFRNDLLDATDCSLTPMQHRRRLCDRTFSAASAAQYFSIGLGKVDLPTFSIRTGYMESNSTPGPDLRAALGSQIPHSPREMGTILFPKLKWTI